MRVDDHHVHALAPALATGEQPLDHHAAGAPRGLPKQTLSTGQIDEPGLPRIRALPGTGLLVADPPRAAEAGLIDTQHRGGLWLTQHRRGAGVDRALDRGPRDPMRPCHLTKVATLADRVGARGTQPGRRPRSVRHLLDRLGERGPSAPRLDAPPPALVPDQLNRC